MSISYKTTDLRKMELLHYTLLKNIIKLLLYIIKFLFYIIST